MISLQILVRNWPAWPKYPKVFFNNIESNIKYICIKYTVDHLILLKKLKLYDITDKNLAWFESYLSNR